METSLLKTLAAQARLVGIEDGGASTRPPSTHRTGRASASRPAIERSGRKPLVARFGGIPLRRQKDAVITDRLPVPGIIRHKELVTRLLADRCEICGHADQVEVHQVRKLADLGKPGQPQPAWAELMARRRRKTLVVCPSCHDTIHGQPRRSSRRSHRRAVCGENRMRRSGGGSPEKDPRSGHLAGGLPAPCGTTWQNTPRRR